MRASRVLAVAGLLILAVGLLGLDTTVANGPREAHVLDWLVDATDAAFLRHVSGFLLPVIALVASAFYWRMRGRYDAFVGASAWLVTVMVADFAKPIFGRPRPFQTDQVSRDWFAGPDFGSFPSGHAAWHVGLVLALALTGGVRWQWLLPLPILIAAQRVVSGDHYLSDVGGSLLIAAAVFAVAGRIVNLPAGRSPEQTSNEPA